MHIRADNPALRGGTLQQSEGAAGQLRQQETEALPTVGKQLSENLFTRAQPQTANAEDYPELQAILVALEPYKRRLAALAGDRDADYALVLSVDGSAAIDERGLIYLGAGFLRQHRMRMEVLVGAIAHEIGHRPKRMATLGLKQALNKAELASLLMHEEIRADIFAGKGMGELDLDVEPLIEYLVAAQSPPHPAYLPVEERARLLREHANAGRDRSSMRKKLFPDFDRATSMRNHLREL